MYVLAQVLHDWSDADALRILRRCADAHAEMGVLMLALFGAKERTIADYTTLLGEAGLEVASVQRSPDLLGVIEARRTMTEPSSTTRISRPTPT